MTKAEREQMEIGKKTYTAIRFRQFQAKLRGMTVEQLDEADRREREGFANLGHD